MGIEARLVLYAEDETTARAAARDAFATLADLDRTLSDYDEGSELSALVRAAAASDLEDVPVSRDLHAVLTRALTVARSSGGAFDVTAAPVVRLWREARAAGRPPSADAIARARERVGWSRLSLTDGGVTLAAGTELDLGGIGKGFACDRALAALSDAGIDRALVQLGGDLAVSGAPPGRPGWRVAVGCNEGGEPLDVTHAAVSTSGDSEQFLLLDGVRYSHVVDPRTGRAKTDDLCASVLAGDGATADALASAVRVLGAADGAALVERFGARLLLPAVAAAREDDAAPAGPPGAPRDPPVPTPPERTSR